MNNTLLGTGINNDNTNSVGSVFLAWTALRCCIQGPSLWPRTALRAAHKRQIKETKIVGSKTLPWIALRCQVQVSDPDSLEVELMLSDDADGVQLIMEPQSESALSLSCFEWEYEWTKTSLNNTKPILLAIMGSG